MRLMAVLCVFLMYMIPNAHAEVELKGKLVIQNTYGHIRYLGQVINNTETPVTDVKITITVKDSTENVIEVVDGYIKGHANPGDRLPDTFATHWLPDDFYRYLPAGATAPFEIGSDVDFKNIASYSTEISYESTSAVNEYQDDVVLKGDINYSNDNFYGEIENRTGVCIDNVSVLVVFEDREGTILGYECAWLYGQNYIHDGIESQKMIMPGTSSPFTFYLSSSDCDFSDIGSYYTIINFNPTSDSAYQCPGKDKIYVVRDITATDSRDILNYTGEIQNDSQYDIFFVNINIISRDSQGKIVDITWGSIEGSSYELDNGTITHQHLAPGEKGPFKTYSFIYFDEIASFEYIINYKLLKTTDVEKNAPVVFGLKGNYPNPFNPVTTIEFSLPEPSSVRLVIFNASGQKIEELVNGRLDAGQHSVVWDASQNASGAYICRLMTDKGTETKKMLFLK